MKCSGHVFEERSNELAAFKYLGKILKLSNLKGIAICMFNITVATLNDFGKRAGKGRGVLRIRLLVRVFLREHFSISTNLNFLCNVEDSAYLFCDFAKGNLG